MQPAKINLETTFASSVTVIKIRIKVLYTLYLYIFKKKKNNKRNFIKYHFNKTYYILFFE